MKSKKDKIAVPPRVARLLRKVQADIIANAVRFDMDRWVNPYDEVAPCGTTACIAGFIHMRHLMKTKGLSWAKAGLRLEKLDYVGGCEIASFAAKQLGIQRWRTLFLAQEWPEPFKSDYASMNYNPDSEDAERGIAAYRRVVLATIAAQRLEHYVRTKE